MYESLRNTAALCTSFHCIFLYSYVLCDNCASHFPSARLNYTSWQKSSRYAVACKFASSQIVIFRGVQTYVFMYCVSWWLQKRSKNVAVIIHYEDIVMLGWRKQKYWLIKPISISTCNTRKQRFCQNSRISASRIWYVQRLPYELWVKTKHRHTL